MLAITTWIDLSLTAIQPDVYFDIHIDELVASHKKSDTNWIDGLLSLLAFGWKHLADRDRDVTLAGCISLRSLETEIGINFAKLADMQEELDMTPPSLYLFPRGTEEWKRDNSGFIEVDLPDLAQCGLYLEYKYDIMLEFSRSIWIVPNAN